ncbi:hypothetical protein LY76DRAFT_422425 [Colletotrichum caudatum]|nr:hypothetical protein LY76DRAFT_422425 [Colletotrichum caudatum]
MEAPMPGTLPACAVPCMSQALNFTTCAVANLTCLCQDDTYISVLRSCVRASCDLEQSYMAKNVTWTRCGFPYNNQTGTVAGRFTLLIGTAFFVILRLLAKALRLSTWGADDVMLIIGYFFSLSFAISRFHGHQLGVGRDVWALSPEQITQFLHGFFAFEVIYTLSISTIKASFLFFYIRVFSMVRNTFTLVLWATQAFNIAFCVAFTIANLAQCQPFSNAWKAWDGKHPGHCINAYAMFVSHAVINIALDAWLLILPITQILGLNMRKREKAEIMFMFGLGAFIAVVSAIRLRVLVSLEGFRDPTYDAFYLHMWSFIELSVAVVVACLPAARQLWRHLTPKFVRSIGLKSPVYQGHDRRKDSTQRLKNILLVVNGQDKSIPNGSCAASTV